MKLGSLANQIYIVALNEAKMQQHEFLTPEHFLYACILFKDSQKMLSGGGADIDAISKDLLDYLENNLESVPGCIPSLSHNFSLLLSMSERRSEMTGKKVIELEDILLSFFHLSDSYALYILTKNGFKKSSFLKSRFFSYGEKNTDSNAKSRKNEISPKEAEFLAKFTQELTSKAAKGDFDPLIGREDVIERTIQVLARRLKNNPVHVGDPGVGKTAIVQGLAQMIVLGKVPEIIANSKIYFIDIASVVAGTKYRGEFEERFLKLLEIIQKDENPIIYIDEIHTVIGTGSVNSGSSDASSLLKPYLLKGNMRVIGSTTYSEYKKIFEKDRALDRRFQKIDVSEPSVNDCIKILNGLKEKYEAFHNVTYTDDAIKSACLLSARYINNKQLPDKAIDVIDEAGAFINTSQTRGDLNPLIDKAFIEKVVSKMTGINIESLNDDETEKLRGLDEKLKLKIFGQDKAIETVVNAIKASRAGLSNPDKPAANFLFVGPTGVGKTELAKQLASTLDIPLVRFDMSEYQEKHSVSKLIGSPPGYVGYEEGGLLTDAVNKTPYCIVLLDEIEKAHQDIYNVLLQIMDYGTLTDNTGKNADFKNTILIMTSNAGAKDINKRIIGFDDKTMGNSAVNDEVKKTFSPEFINRIDEIVIFNSIDNTIAVSIVNKNVEKLKDMLKNKNVRLTVSDSALRYIAENSISEKYGAREISRNVETTIKKVLVDEILFGRLKEGGAVSIGLKNNKISFSYRNIEDTRKKVKTKKEKVI